MKDKPSHTHNAQSDVNDGDVADRTPEERSRKTKEGISEPTSSQKAQEEQDRQLKSGEENPD
jgi:hypothetical protein